MVCNNHTFPYDHTLDSKSVVAHMPGVAQGKNKDVFSGSISSTNVVFGRRKRTINASFHAIGENLGKDG